jgi:hypothetical protein
MLSHWLTLLRQRSRWHYFQGGGFGIEFVLLQIKHQPTTAYYHPPGQGDDGGAPPPSLRGPRLMCCPTLGSPWLALQVGGQQHLPNIQALNGAPLVLPNQFLSIHNEHKMNEFIIQIDYTVCLKKNHG